MASRRKLSPKATKALLIGFIAFDVIAFAIVAYFVVQSGVIG